MERSTDGNNRKDPLRHLENRHPAQGWPTSTLTFRAKRDAEDWARRTEDEMIRGVYVRRSSSEKILVQDALKRYLKEITPTKRPSNPTGGKDARKAADCSTR
jgi:hypothetical protein